VAEKTASRRHCGILGWLKAEQVELDWIRLCCRRQELVAQGKGQLAFAEVFDTEAEGAWQALRTAVAIAEQAGGQGPDITVCTDNTAIVYSINGTASASSQVAFLKFQRTRSNTGAKRTSNGCRGTAKYRALLLLLFLFFARLSRRLASRRA